MAILGAMAALTGLVLFAWGWLEGSPTPRGRIAPVVTDEARMLGPEATLAIQRTMFPPDVPVLVRTIDSPISSIAGAVATDMMERENYWQTVRPRTWHQRHVKRRTPWGTGVYVLVSRQPPLVQVRFGEDIRLDAYRAGLAAGPGYRRMQNAFSVAPTDVGIVALVTNLSQRLPAVLDSPWLLSFVKRLASNAFSEIEEFALPSEGAFRIFVLRRYVGLLQRFDAASSGWRFLTFTAVCYGLIWSSAYLLTGLLGRRFKTAGAIGGTVLSLLAKIVYVVAAIGSLLLLANGRAEDELLLRDLGLQQLRWAGFDAPYFWSTGGWLLSIVTALIALCAAFLETIEDLDESRSTRAKRRSTSGSSRRRLCGGRSFSSCLACWVFWRSSTEWQRALVRWRASRAVP